MAEFVVCKHKGVEGTAVLARSALPFMPGWEPVSPADVAPGGEVTSSPQVAGFVPNGHTVDEVNAYLAEHPDQVAAVLGLEAAGQARKGIVEGPHAAQ